MAEFLIDTNTLSYLVKEVQGWQRIAAKIDLYGRHRCAISAITWHELRFGRLDAPDRVSKDQIAKMDAEYGAYKVLEFDKEAASIAAEIRVVLARRGTPIGTPDCMIAGHAVRTGRVMVTANVKEFARVSGLTVQNWLT